MANSFFLDASALAKRYVPERGSAQVSAIIDAVPGGRLYLLIIGTGEIVSILVRKRNAGVFSVAYFRQALANFDAEIVRAADITKVPVTGRLVTASLRLGGLKKVSGVFWKKVSGVFCAKHPAGRSGKRLLTPFSACTVLSRALGRGGSSSRIARSISVKAA